MADPITPADIVKVLDEARLSLQAAVASSEPPDSYDRSRIDASIRACGDTVHRIESAPKELAAKLAGGPVTIIGRPASDYAKEWERESLVRLCGPIAAGLSTSYEELLEMGAKDQERMRDKFAGHVVDLGRSILAKIGAP